MDKTADLAAFEKATTLPPGTATPAWPQPWTVRDLPPSLQHPPHTGTAPVPATILLGRKSVSGHR